MIVKMRAARAHTELSCCSQESGAHSPVSGWSGGCKSRRVRVRTLDGTLHKAYCTALYRNLKYQRLIKKRALRFAVHWFGFLKKYDHPAGKKSF